MLVGTLSKALGAYGGYVCTRREIAELLVNRSRTLIYSTAPPPAAIAGALAALELLVEQPRRPQQLQAGAAVLRRELAGAGVPVPDGSSRLRLAVMASHTAGELAAAAGAIRDAAAAAGVTFAARDVAAAA